MMKKLIFTVIALMSTPVFATSVYYICPAPETISIKPHIGHSQWQWLVSGQLTKQVNGQTSKIEISNNVFQKGMSSLKVLPPAYAYGTFGPEGVSHVTCSYSSNLPYELVLYPNPADYIGKNCQQISNDTIECELP
jgi:hypothetical protein